MLHDLSAPPLVEKVYSSANWITLRRRTAILYWCTAARFVWHVQDYSFGLVI